LIDAGAGIEAGGLHRRRLGPWIALGLCCAIAIAIGVVAGARLHRLQGDHGLLGADRAATALHGQATWAAGTHPAPAISALRDQSGRVFSLGSLRGRTVAMVFFDSHCNQACPLEGRAIAASELSLARAQRPVLVVVSVNPDDTSASTRAAVRKWGLAGVAPWHWLRGTHAELATVWRDYHIFVAPPRDGDIAHTEALYLIDRRGDERSGYLYPFVPRFVTLDLRTLATERGA
jgi:cytochrome oxidase Cu insertion factor (SCO1/SenC/PrrC family)